MNFLIITDGHVGGTEIQKLAPTAKPNFDPTKLQLVPLDQMH